ncbi:chlorophyll synthesis pathway protein BchC [uncultured Rhodospira sp.]|uniref:chlorophyll synthesis pathway protein BchC n=1 Tax=uncultured Rhodospira sp. TaxID=1936189 RepID=UPI002625CC99|nr:chlorophyll synthesis pathway protein BchC [uncultured Rhodospira sp.]
MHTDAIVIQQPERLSLTRLDLEPPEEADVVVEIEWSGISTGTERLLWTGRMPPFPGMGYPLVPGYESVGRVTAAGAESGRTVGERVFVPGAKCYGEVRGLFGGAASRIVVPGARVLPVPDDLGERAVLLALAATARHALAGGATLPDLVVGHGVLGRLVARLVVAMGGAAPVVWETNPARTSGAMGYAVVDPSADERRDYACICDVSGDAAILDMLMARLARGGEIVLAGFYEGSLRFDFVAAFLREARLRVAAEWRPEDLAAVTDLIGEDRLSLDDLITHRATVEQAEAAYRTAFEDPSCLKMILDWRARA